MEIGSLADWFTGIATLLAVITTLSLSFYNQNKRELQSKRNAAGSILRLTDVIYQKVANKEISVDQVNNDMDFKKLQSYLEILTFASFDTNGKVIEIGEKIENLFIIGIRNGMNAQFIKQYKSNRAELLKILN